ncbi:MAG: TraR/DksA family transcriptional regulator [Acidobacteria bacterium]|nr:TraR/DksA family transcriptional regulator [Acidobacteriota bacterium]
MSSHATAPTRRQNSLAPKQIRELRELLLAEQKELLEAYQSNVEKEKDISFDDAEDYIDRAEKGWDREELLALTEAERDRLLLVEEALGRMRRGTYGLCFADDAPIPFVRLEAIPWARYCAEHQKDLEEGTLKEPTMNPRMRFPVRSREESL